MSEPSKPPDHKPPRFEIAQAAMLLLGIMVIAGVLGSLLVTVRCTLWPIAFCDRDWQLRAWFTDLIIALIALITRPREP